MARATLILASRADRDKAHKWIEIAPVNTRITFAETKRSIPQNDRLHAMITEIARQLAWHGQKLSVDDWKKMFMQSLNKEARFVPAIDGRGFVDLGNSTSKLSVRECSDLMEIIAAFGAQHQVVFKEME